MLQAWKIIRQIYWEASTVNVKGQIHSISRQLYIILEPCLKEEKMISGFPLCRLPWEDLIHNTKDFKIKHSKKCAQSACVYLNPKGVLKEQNNCESSIERPSTTVSYKGWSVKLNYLEYPVNQNIKKAAKSRYPWVFLWTKQGATRPTKKEASKSLSISSAFLCFPASFSSSPRWAVCIFTWSHCSAFQGG